MNLKNLYQKIYKDLKKHSNKEWAEKDKKYHKYDGYVSWGLSGPVFAGVMKKYKKEIKNLSCGEVLELAEMFYKTKIGEFIFAGTFVLENNLDCMDKKWLPFFDKVLEYFTSWGTIDDFSCDVLRHIILKYPKETFKYLKKWSRSPNMWKRRISVVAFVREVGRNGDFTKEALTLCENLIWDKEDMVAKGVGWCLKDIMRGEKKPVLEYVKNLRKRGASSVITLYAIRDLRGKERQDVLML